MDTAPIELHASLAEPDGAWPDSEWPDGVAVGGGWFGWLGFELARTVESIPPPPPRPVPMAPFDLAFHDHVVRCEPDGSWWFEALWTPGRAEALADRLAVWRRRLRSTPPAPAPFRAGPLQPYGSGLEGHRAAVAQTTARIADGEFSQANICLRFEGCFEGDPLEAWVAAARRSAPAYAAYVEAVDGAGAVLSLSPELFLARRARAVLTRPIKGTAPIESDPAELARSVKDRAENVMIVDLMRNDLGRVCEIGSIHVDALCEVRPAAGVWHLESTVAGRLRPGIGDRELLRATFPPGSVSGAPKVQALHTIHELESTAREAYCGAVGICSPLWGLELNVAIRTLEARDGRLWLGAGGGIVADSSPDAEVREALDKARGVLSSAGLELAAGSPTDSLPSRLDAGRVHRPRPHGSGEITRLARPDPICGVFETMRVSEGRAPWLDEHLRRLAHSCAELGLELPDDLASRIAAPLAEHREGAIRVSITRSGVVISARPLPPPGVPRLKAVVLPGGLGAHKWVDRGLIDALSTDGHVPMFCDLDGAVLEAGYAAVLIVVADTLLVPELDGRLLASISRAHALAAARATGFRVQTAHLTLDDLHDADGIILTSSVRGPHPAVLGGGDPPALCERVCRTLTAAL